MVSTPCMIKNDRFDDTLQIPTQILYGEKDTVMAWAMRTPKAQPGGSVFVNPGIFRMFQFYREHYGLGESMNDMIIDTDGSTGFDYDGTVTREEFALMLYKCADSSETAGTLDAFPDKEKVGSGMQKALRWAVEKGIILGKNGSILDPASAISRAEVATMLERYSKIK